MSKYVIFKVTNKHYLEWSSLAYYPIMNGFHESFVLFGKDYSKYVSSISY